MSSPFVIWTMQRTGGTSLTELLMEMSEHRSAEHEPFNWARKQPRQFWPITDAWNTTHNVEVLRASLEGLFAQRYLIKHCYELLSMSFNMHLMQAAAEAPYRHIILRRRDEPSRLVSKFIAEAQGTWFKDYARKVFSQVSEGERQLGPLPVDRVVGHYRHSVESTKFIDDTLKQLGVPRMDVWYEDLYSGSRAERLAHLHRLFDFLGFTTDEVARHEALVEDKIFHSGQNTRSVAGMLPNIGAVLEALHAAGCDVSGSPLTDGVVLLPHRDGPAGPRDRIGRECVILAQTYGADGPFLEIGAEGPQHAVLNRAEFRKAERLFVGRREGPAADGLAARVADPNDLGAAVADGSVGTVLWINGLAHDRRFWRTLDEIKRVLRPGGALIVVTPGFARGAGQTGNISITGQKGNAIPDATITLNIHEVPDYWRLSPQGLRDAVLDGFEVREVRVMMVPPRLFGLAVKPLDPAAAEQAQAAKAPARRRAPGRPRGSAPRPAKRVKAPGA